MSDFIRPAAFVTRVRLVRLFSFDKFVSLVASDRLVRLVAFVRFVAFD